MLRYAIVAFYPDLEKNEAICPIVPFSLPGTRRIDFEQGSGKDRGSRPFPAIFVEHAAAIVFESRFAILRIVSQQIIFGIGLGCSFLARERKRKG